MTPKHATICPACDKKHIYERHLIQHLMNSHGWRTEFIGRWLDEVRGKDSTGAGEIIK